MPNHYHYLAKIFQNSDFIKKVTDSDIFNQKLNYVYENAWRKGLCKKPGDWQWSGGSLVKNGELNFIF